MTTIEELIQGKETFSVIVCDSFGDDDIFLVTSPSVVRKYHLKEERTYKGASVVNMDKKDIRYFYKNLGKHFNSVQKTDFSIVYEVNYSSFFVMNLLKRVFYIDKIVSFFDMAEKDLNKHNEYIDKKRNSRIKKEIFERITSMESGYVSKEEAEELRKHINELESYNEGIYDSIKRRFTDLQRKTRKIADRIETNIYHS